MRIVLGEAMRRNVSCISHADISSATACTTKEPFRARGVHRKSHQCAVKSAVSPRFRRYVFPPINRRSRKHRKRVGALKAKAQTIFTACCNVRSAREHHRTDFPRDNARNTACTRRTVYGKQLPRGKQPSCDIVLGNILREQTTPRRRAMFRATEDTDRYTKRAVTAAARSA